MSDNIQKFIGEIQTDVKWIKKKLDTNDSKFARKWVEKALGFMMVGVFGWVITQLLSMINEVQALFD